MTHFSNQISTVRPFVLFLSFYLTLTLFLSFSFPFFSFTFSNSLLFSLFRSLYIYLVSLLRFTLLEWGGRISIYKCDRCYGFKNVFILYLINNNLRTWILLIFKLFFISTFISSTNGTIHIYFWDFDIIACFSLLIVNNITSA